MPPAKPPKKMVATKKRKATGSAAKKKSDSQDAEIFDFTGDDDGHNAVIAQQSPRKKIRVGDGSPSPSSATKRRADGGANNNNSSNNNSTNNSSQQEGSPASPLRIRKRRTPRHRRARVSDLLMPAAVPSAPSAAAAAAPASAPARTVTPQDGSENNNDDDDDDDDGGGKVGACRDLQRQQQHQPSRIKREKPIIKRESAARASSAKGNQEPEIIDLLDSDSEIEEVPRPAALFPDAVASAARNTDNDNDIEFIGTANEQRLPHARHDCLEFKFDPNHDKSINQQFCSLCYCYVCDMNAKDCQKWATGVHRLENHCHANDRNQYSEYWKQQRALKQALNGGHTGGYNHANHHHNSNLKYGVGPFSPEDTVAAQDPNLTNCRKCGYFNRFFHRNFTHYKKLHPTGFLDWCHKCGRVASDKDFGKVQREQPLKEQAGDICLGTKQVSFRIVSHDPRIMKRYHDHWEDHKADWNYVEDEMREDLFHHRFGTRPTLQMILESIPIVAEEDMPKDGSTYMHPSAATYQNNYYNESAADRLYADQNQDLFEYWKHRDGNEYEKVASADETEGIILEKSADSVLFRQLRLFEDEKFCERKAPTPSTAGKKSLLSYDITAHWDKENQVGTFSVRLYVQPEKKFKPKYAASFNRLLGAWYDVFPFALSDLAGSLAAEKPSAVDLDAGGYYGAIAIPVPPFRVTPDKRKEVIKSIKHDRVIAVKEHNSNAKQFRDSLCLQSTEEKKGLGGQCSLELGFSNVLQRYFKEMLVEDIFDGPSDDNQWLNVGLGVSVNHRRVRRRGEELCGRLTSREDPKDLSYLRCCDQPLASHLKGACRSIYYGTKSLKGIISHSENLGHDEIEPFDGLTVELLQFQRQSVQMALQMETLEGGIQSLIFPALPSVGGPQNNQQQVYYNPIIESFRTEKPNVVRGGILAQEMGLGKTIISLSLILVNPAPELPASDSPIEELDELQTTPWDKDLYPRSQLAQDANPKRGSIISRGTLVICPVSLVGQWIEEAKSRLADPGLVYSYHGQNRKRDAHLLAQNAIVVTTYEILASDATYHKGKAGADYVAPLAQIRWWRCIADESHTIRDGNTTKSRAIMELVADHKWLVTGTPVNTSITDLKNQLKFLGLESLNEMFGKLGNTVSHTSGRGTKNGSSRRRSSFRRAGLPGNEENLTSSATPNFGHFMYLLRCIMIRHAQQQSYRGTGPPATTLMSLPPKTERTVEVKFTKEESLEYSKLEDAARSFYSSFKAKRGKDISKNKFLLQKRLIPLQIAAAGGRIPLDETSAKLEADADAEDADADDDNENEDEEDNDGDEEEDQEEEEEEEEDEDEEEAGEAKPKKKRKEVLYSKFVFKSKFDKLLKELKHARDNDPTSKSLVFSQFTSSLKYLQEELPKHGFQFRSLSGDMPMRQRAKALHDFQHDPPTTIFLLSMRAGAVGINLTQANRVFLLEPHFNPAIERQSIGRVHRLGQKRKVEIIRLVMKDSIETRIVKLNEAKFGDREEGDDAGRLVGCIANDTNSINRTEFDMLYGVEESMPSAAAAAAVMPDAAASSGVGETGVL